MVWCVCAFSILIEVQKTIHSVDHATLLDKPGLNKQHFWFTYFENNFGDPCCTTRFQ